MAVNRDISVIAVHGAWADGSSWRDVILSLEREGLRVIAAPISLTSLSDDTAALKRAISRTQGPVILAGHAYAGASQGIGRSTAIRLARDFPTIVLAARNADALRETGESVKAARTEPFLCVLDLSKVESAKELVKKTLDRFGRIDALLNIAGAVPQIDLFEMTDEQWRDGMELKLHGARRVTIFAWDALKKSKGSVVFMSGSAAPRSQTRVRSSGGNECCHHGSC
jgi:short chain dehydrogenase